MILNKILPTKPNFNLFLFSKTHSLNLTSTLTAGKSPLPIAGEFCNYRDLRLPVFVRRLFFAGFPNALQNPQAETFGDGGSIAGDTFPVRYPRPPLDRLLSMVVLIGSTAAGVDLTSLISGFSSSFRPDSLSDVVAAAFFNSPDRNRSSQTSPDEPCLLKETADLCKPSMAGIFARKINLEISSVFFFFFFFPFALCEVSLSYIRKREREMKGNYLVN